MPYRKLTLECQTRTSGSSSRTALANRRRESPRVELRTDVERLNYCALCGGWSVSNAIKRVSRSRAYLNAEPFWRCGFGKLFKEYRELKLLPRDKEFTRGAGTLPTIRYNLGTL